MPPHVTLTRCTSYDDADIAAALAEALAPFDLPGLVIGKTVLLKPNLLAPVKPDRAATTHPAVVKALARMCLGAGAAGVTITDSPGGPYNGVYVQQVYRITGMADAARESGAEISNDMSHRTVTSNGRELEIISPVLDADVVISVAKLKTHAFMRFTGAVKNMYGAMPGLVKSQMHSKQPDRAAFADFMVDLYNARKPDLCVIDGVIGMEGDGPMNGKPKQANMILASDDGFAADAIAAQAIGINPALVPILAAGVRRGLLDLSPGAIQTPGLPLDEARVAFAPAATQRKLSFFISFKSLLGFNGRALFPAVNGKCVGCGDCERICPRHVIKIADKRADIDLSGCIRCYCCHEMCRYGAMYLLTKRKIKKRQAR